MSWMHKKKRIYNMKEFEALIKAADPDGVSFQSEVGAWILIKSIIMSIVVRSESIFFVISDHKFNRKQHKV